MALDKVLGWFNVVYVRYLFMMKSCMYFFPEVTAFLWILLCVYAWLIPVGSEANF